MILLNILVLVFEILYYSIFMYYAKGEGKFKRYLLLFSLITIINIFIESSNFYYHLLLILLIYLGIKILINKKTKLYDIFLIYLMFIFKIILEIIFSYPIYNVINDIYLSALIVGNIKFLIVLINKRKIKIIFKKLNKIWYKNNFYIRYVLGILGIFYVALSCLYIIIEFI